MLCEKTGASFKGNSDVENGSLDMKLIINLLNEKQNWFFVIMFQML